MAKISITRSLIVVTLLCSSIAVARPHRLSREASLYAHDYGVGLTFCAGGISGLSLVTPWDNTSYVQGSVGISLIRGEIALTGDYIIELKQYLSSSLGIEPYAGLGAFVVKADHYDSLVSDSEGSFHLGARLPLGAYVVLKEVPVQIFGEFTPGLQLSSDINLTLSIALGARWLF